MPVKYRQIGGVTSQPISISEALGANILFRGDPLKTVQFAMPVAGGTKVSIMGNAKIAGGTMLDPASLPSIPSRWDTIVASGAISGTIDATTNILTITTGSIDTGLVNPGDTVTATATRMFGVESVISATQIKLYRGATIGAPTPIGIYRAKDTGIRENMFNWYSPTEFTAAAIQLEKGKTPSPFLLDGYGTDNGSSFRCLAARANIGSIFVVVGTYST